MATHDCSYCKAELSSAKKRDQHEKDFHPAKGKATRRSDEENPKGGK